MLFCLLLPLQVEANEEVFRKAFGKAPPKTVYSLTVDVRLDGEPHPKLTLTYNPYTLAVNVPIEYLKSLLQPNFLPEAYQKVLQLPTAKGWISQAQLESLGFGITFNQSYLTLAINSPPNSRKLRRISISTNKAYLTIPKDVPSTYSGFVNILGRHKSNQTNPDDTVFLALDGLATVKDWFTIEGEASYANNRDSRFILSSARLIHDDYNRKQSYFLGDIRSGQVFDASPGTSILGAGFSHSYRNFGWQAPRPTFSQHVFLDKPSFVKIERNTHQIYYKRLEAGQYQFDTIELRRGLNAITILISPTDGSPTKVYYKNRYHSNRLTIPGVFEYNAAMGLPAIVTDQYRLSSHHWTYGASLLYGYSDTKTLTSALTHSKDTSRLSLGLQSVNRLGEIDTDISLGLQPTAPESHGFLLRYRTFDTFTDKGNLYSHQLAFGLNTHQAIRTDTNTTLFKNESFLNHSYIHSLGPNVTLRIQSGLSFFPDTGTQLWNQNYSFTKRYSSIGLQGRIGWEQTALNDLIWNFSLRLNTFYSHSTQSFAVQDRNGTLSSILSTNKSGTDRRDLYYSLSQIQNEETGTNYSLTGRWRNKWLFAGGIDTPHSESQNHNYRVSYRGTRGYIQHSVSHSQGNRSNETSFQTALAFVDGHAGFSKRINRNFVLFYTPKPIKDNRIMFSGNSQIDEWGPAVVTNLLPFRKQFIHVESSDLPHGLFLDSQSFDVTPSLRRGIALPITTGGFNMVQAMLLDEQGQPLSRVFGDLYREDNPDIKTPVFTSRKGRLVGTGLKPGRYILAFSDSSLRSIQFEIKDSDETLTNLGTIYVKNK